MKVYVLTLFDKINNDIKTQILGVYKTKTLARKSMKAIAKNDCNGWKDDKLDFGKEVGKDYIRVEFDDCYDFCEYEVKEFEVRDEY